MKKTTLLLAGIVLAMALPAAAHEKSHGNMQEQGHGKEMQSMPGDMESHEQASTKGIVKLLKASIVADKALKEGEISTLVLKLEDVKGTPVTMKQLQEVHTRKMHLLIADETLTDYRHVHPTAGKKPGSYVASFTPKKAGNYKIWIDITPIGGSQQFIPVLLEGEKPCTSLCIDEKVSSKGTADGLRASMSFEKPLKAGEEDMGMVQITDASGKPVTDLEPIMGAFAHIVGFYDDFATVAHIHPMDKEPTAETDRGGPDLSFHIEPAKPGFLKLYVQVRRNEQDVFIPLSVIIQ